MGRWGACCAAVALAAACGGSEGSGVVGSRTVGAAVSVGIDPSSAEIAPGARLQLHAAVAGAADPGVVWRVLESDGGTVDASGLYTAPAGEGTFHVLAISRADAGKSGTAALRVRANQAGDGDLIDGGGAVFPATRTFALWWGDAAAFGSDVRPHVEAFLSGLDGSRYLALADQYMRGAKTSSRFAGSLVDGSTPNGDYDSAACAALARAGLHPQAGDVVMVYGAKPVAQSSTWCAQHGAAVCDGVTVLTAYVPYPGSLCVPYGADAGCNQASDEARAVASLSAHELMETITDPFDSSWLDANGKEIGDKCVASRSCEHFATGVFQVQGAWSNAAHACAP